MVPSFGNSFIFFMKNSNHTELHSFPTRRSSDLGRGTSGASRPRQSAQCRLWPSATATSRSEEHTSELQSRQYLVCRLLLEKNYSKYQQQLYQYHEKYQPHKKQHH